MLLTEDKEANIIKVHIMRMFKVHICKIPDQVMNLVLIGNVNVFVCFKRIIIKMVKSIV